jgi:hypothetical protein
MSKTFKTPKGTELPFLNLKGKDYLQVAHRLIWFREEKPDWTIETEYVAITDQSAIARATIKDQTGRVLVTAHKQESKTHFMDFIEKCESGAVGRALAMLGYGTQFAQELEEEERIVDSPLNRKTNGAVATTQASQAKELIGSQNVNKPVAAAPAPNPEPKKESVANWAPSASEAMARLKHKDTEYGQYVFKLGKFKDKKVYEVPASMLKGYVEFFNGKELEGEMKIAITAVKNYLQLSQNNAQ